jgi:hypothetical protein
MVSRLPYRFLKCQPSFLASQTSAGLKGIAFDLVDAALAADVTVENYRAVPPVDAQ